MALRQQGIPDMSPDNEMTARIFAFFAILVEPRVPSGHEIALKLFRKYSGYGMIALTYALSLLRRKRGGDELRLLENFPDGQRGRTDLFRTWALARQATERQAEAKQAASVIDASPLSPESFSLLEAAGLRPGPTGGGAP